LLVHTEYLDVATDYGPLKVPVRDVRSIEFGLRLPEGVQAKVQAAVADLAGNDYRAREKGTKTLVELGPYAYPAALDASRSKELEVARRAREILKQFEAKYAKKDLRTSKRTSSSPARFRSSAAF